MNTDAESIKRVREITDNLRKQGVPEAALAPILREVEEAETALAAAEHGGRCEACGGSGWKVAIGSKEWEPGKSELCPDCGGTGAAPGGGR